MAVQNYGRKVGTDKVVEKEYYGQILADAYTRVDKIPLHQRILEIMREKGDAFSIRAVALRTGMSLGTLKFMLQEKRGRKKRPIYNYELDKMLPVLKVTRDRLFQYDIYDDSLAFDAAMRNKEYKVAIDILEKSKQVAIGYSERFRVCYDLGRAHYFLQEYDKAHQLLLEAKQCAESIERIFGNSEKLFVVMKTLLNSFIIRREYSYAFEIIQKVENTFKDNPERYGVICHSHAMIAYDQGNLELYREKMYEALACFQKTDDDLNIGKALHNVAYIEFQFGNYHKSKELFQEAIKTLKNDFVPKIIAQKDYVKTLLELGHMEEAIRLIHESLIDVECKNKPDLKAKLLVLRSLATGDMSYADKVISMDGVSHEIRINACRQILRYCSENNDSESLMRYYRIEQSLLYSDSSKFDEEGL